MHIFSLKTNSFSYIIQGKSCSRLKVYYTKTQNLVEILFTLTLLFSKVSHVFFFPPGKLISEE